MAKIKNFDNLALTSFRRAALLIAEAGLQAIDTRRLIEKNVRITDEKLFVRDSEFLLSGKSRIFFVGIGKCAGEAALAFEEILGERLKDGVLIDVRAISGLKKIRSYQGTHPLPSNENVKAAKEIVSILKSLKENDFIIFVISGGGSTLLCLPEDVACEEEAKIIHSLMNAGAKIQEINTVRKHLSLARGGYLAKYAFPANGVALIFSDVPGDDVQFVASGPTVKDETSIEDAEKILAKYDVLRVCPVTHPDGRYGVCGIEKCGLVETPKEEKYFEEIKNILFVSNKVALEAMAKKAEELGFKPKICTTCLEGETRDAAEKIVEELHKTPPQTVLLYGGETTVTVHGAGRGGRNMEFALSTLRDLGDGELILALASDGIDNGDFAGAICDKITREKSEKLGFDLEKFLNENNEYPFFKKVGDYILTGPTGSNVSDLIIAIHD